MSAINGVCSNFPPNPMVGGPAPQMDKSFLPPAPSPGGMFDALGASNPFQLSANMPVMTNSLVNPAMFSLENYGSYTGQSTTGTADMVQQIAGTIMALIQSISAKGGTSGKAKIPESNIAASAQEKIKANGDNAPGAPGTLKGSLEAIASDPDGAKLIEAAKAKGVKIEVGNPDQAMGQFDIAAECQNCKNGVGDGHQSAAKDGTSQTNGVTLSNTQTGKIRIVVRDPSNIKTIAHELVHAVSTKDRNSLEEEGIADVIGSRIANRLGGEAVGGLSGSEQFIYKDKQKFYRVGPGLSAKNNIRSTLAKLGLSVSV